MTVLIHRPLLSSKRHNHFKAHSHYTESRCTDNKAGLNSPITSLSKLSSGVAEGKGEG